MGRGVNGRQKGIMSLQSSGEEFEEDQPEGQETPAPAPHGEKRR